MARIGLLDDDPLIRELVGDLLASHGHCVTAWSSLAEARAGLAVAPQDLLVIDVELPDGSGLALIEELHAQGRRTPAIVLSGRSEASDFERGFAAGAVDYVAKPVRNDELLGRCAVHLARAQASACGADLPGTGGLAFGRYRPERELGRGGYGRVLLARDTVADRPVALKVLDPTLHDPQEEEEARRRFVRESMTLTELRHPRVAHAHDFGVYQGRYYVALDFIEGPSLREWAARRGPLTEAETRGLAVGLLEALTAVEQANLVHRDVKPDNVILRRGHPSDPVLVDFGLAKRPNDRTLTDASVLVGTIAFMAPEVIEGAEADRRSDLFAVGLTLRYALTGELLFPALSGLKLLQAMTRQPIPPLDVAVSPIFGAWLGMLLAREPEDRPGSAAGALQVLRAMDTGKHPASWEVPTERTLAPGDGGAAPAV